VTWTSPTQTFGMMLFAGAMLLLIGLLRDEDRPWRSVRGRWAMFVLLMAVLAGAKATFLPLLLGGLVGMLVVLFAVRRRLHRPTAIAAVIVFVGFAVAQLVLYRGANLGLSLQPFAAERTFSALAPVMMGFTSETAPMSPVLIAAAVHLLCLVFVWGGVFGLLLRRRFLDPAVLLLLTLGAVGLTLFFMLGHSGDAEGYFISSVRPYLTIAAVVGVLMLLQAGALPRRAALTLVGCLAAGVGLVYLLRLFGNPITPTLATVTGYRQLATRLVEPYAWLVLVCLIGAAAALMWRRRLFGFTMIIALAAGFGLPTIADNFAFMVNYGTQAGWLRGPDSEYLAEGDTTGASAMIRADVASAGAWLRDNTSPDDLVATNAHCLWSPDKAAPCDNRHFAIAAMSERRVLVEGWGFVNKSYVAAAAAGVAPWYGPFWDQDLLAANDAAFTHPSTATIDRLRDQYKVRWLFADEAQGNVAGDLGSFATLRFQSGQVAVYEING
jgi:hypothetical protein